jgi:hypothetical protein
MTETVSQGPQAREVIYRHKLITRITHWTNSICVVVLLMSGLQILNAHPSLYWGQFRADDDHAFIEFFATQDGDDLIGHTRIGPVTMTTTGVFGVSAGDDGEARVIAMPAWATIPRFRDLATGRRWHFFFMSGPGCSTGIFGATFCRHVRKFEQSMFCRTSGITPV